MCMCANTMQVEYGSPVHAYATHEVHAVFWFPTGSNQSVCGGGVLLLNLQRKNLMLIHVLLVYKNVRKSRLA